MVKRLTATIFVLHILSVFRRKDKLTAFAFVPNFVDFKFSIQGSESLANKQTVL